MKFDKTQKRALVFVAGLLGLSWYMGGQFEKADMMRSEALARDWKWKGVGWTPEEEATLSREEKEAVAEQLYNDWRAGKIEATDVDEYYERLENNAETFGAETNGATCASCSKVISEDDIIGDGTNRGLCCVPDYYDEDYDAETFGAETNGATCASCSKVISEDDIIGDGTNRGLCCVPDYYDEDYDAETFGAEQWKPMPQCEECGAVEGGNIDGCDHCDITYWFNGKVYHPDSMIHVGAETMTPSEVKVKVTKDVTPKGSKVIVEECVDIQAKKADATSNYYRVRFRDPAEMSNFRVPAWAARAANTMGSKYYDVAGSKVTMGQDKSGNWKIQSVMVPKRANVDVDLALKIANHIQDRLEKEGKWAPKKCQDNERVLVIR